MNERLTELLPWYVNGTLGAEDRAWVEAQVRADPDAAAELRWHESLQARVREAAPEVSADIGLNKALRRIRAERRAETPSLAERVREWLAGFGLTPALAAALAVVAVQGVIIGGMLTGPADETSVIRATAPVDVVAGPFVRVNFKPDAQEADMRLLLIEVRGEIAAGPSQLGDYYVRVPSGQTEAVAGKLKSNRIVEAVAIVDGLPGKD